MVDILSPRERSAHMRRIRTKNTTPELKVRSALHQAGFRFRLHRSDLPGTPDIVLSRHGVCLFVHGCFWHGHPGCVAARLPASRREFWQQKIQANQDRDRRNANQLVEDGWTVKVIWECETKSRDRLEDAIENLRLV